MKTDVNSTIVEYTFKSSYIKAQLVNKHHSNFTISLNVTDRSINGTAEGQTARKLENSEKTTPLYFEFPEVASILFGDGLIQNDAASTSIKIVMGSTAAVSTASNF